MLCRNNTFLAKVCSRLMKQNYCVVELCGTPALNICLTLPLVLPLINLLKQHLNALSSLAAAILIYSLHVRNMNAMPHGNMNNWWGRILINEKEPKINSSKLFFLSQKTFWPHFDTWIAEKRKIVWLFPHLSTYILKKFQFSIGLRF